MSLVQSASSQKNNHLFSVLVFVITSSIALATTVDLEACQTSEISDNDILQAIETELRSNEVISSDTIDVQVRSGIVTLAGEVQTLVLKRQSISDVGSLKGVRSIIDRLTIPPSESQTKEISKDIVAALNADPTIGTDGIKVKVDDAGKVTLSGTTQSYASRQLTESTVSSVRGVTAIENNIQLDATEPRDHSEIELEIRRRFELSPYLAEGLIKTKVTNDQVTLSGTVGSLNEQKLAKMLSWVRGVNRVDDSELKVDASQMVERRRSKFVTIRSDFELEKAVNDSLLYDPRIRSTRIGVTSRMAAIILTGEVSMLSGKRAAERDAYNTIGVRRVINHLKVRPEKWPGDLEITKNAKEAIDRDSHLTNYQLVASSHFGKLYVSGDVRSHFDKGRVDSVLADVVGVREVFNRVTVNATWVEKGDDDILEDTGRRLAWSPYLDAEQISVSVDDGVVTLTGKVDTWQDQKAATAHAYQAGARRVINNLKVGLGRDFPDVLNAAF